MSAPGRALLALVALVTVGCGGTSETETPVTRTDSVDSAGVSTPTVAAPPPDSADPPDRLSANGWRELEIGMTRAEVVAAAGEDAHPEAVGGPDPATCDEFRPARAPDGLLVMIRDGRLSRISITGGTGIETAYGLGVGDPVSAVEEAYGSTAVATPHAYHPEPARYMTVWQEAPPSPWARGIVYEIGTDLRILRILAGDESIQYAEGCV